VRTGESPRHRQHEDVCPTSELQREGTYAPYARSYDIMYRVLKPVDLAVYIAGLESGQLSRHAAVLCHPVDEVAAHYVSEGSDVGKELPLVLGPLL
jgi:hypothetical protein